MNGTRYWLPVRAFVRDEKDEHRFEVRYSEFRLYHATVTIEPGAREVAAP